MRRWFDRQLNLRSWDGPGLSPLNWVIIALILLSAINFTLETEPAIGPRFAGIFSAINLIVLAIFTLEFFVRIWSAGETAGARGIHERTRYAERRWLVIDFIGFAPELLVLVWLSVSSRDFDLGFAGLKVIRLLRLLKLAHYIPGARMLIDAIHSVRRELVASLVIACGLIYGSAVLIYLVEHDADSENFGSVLSALWWSVITLTTVGYGDVYPHTIIGKLAAGIVALTGVGLVSLPSGIFAGAFIDQLRQRRMLAGTQPGQADSTGKPPTGPLRG